MGDPHNPARYGETWDPKRLAALTAELAELRDACAIDGTWIYPFVLSGGWAWHTMSPPGHVELKHAHDHKDLDVFVRPEDVASLIPVLVQQGYRVEPTRFAPGEDDFRRYQKMRGDVKVIIDLFLRDVPFIEVDGWRVVEPRYLLGLYSKGKDPIHSSSQCFAVQAATKLLARGINPVGRPELVEVPK